MNVLGAGGCDQGKEVGFRPIKKVAFVIKRVGRTTTAPLHFAYQSLPVTDSIITLSKSAALTAELPVPSMSA